MTAGAEEHRANMVAVLTHAERLNVTSSVYICQSEQSHQFHDRNKKKNTTFQPILKKSLKRQFEVFCVQANLTNTMTYFISALGE